MPRRDARLVAEGHEDARPGSGASAEAELERAGEPALRVGVDDAAARATRWPFEAAASGARTTIGSSRPAPARASRTCCRSGRPAIRARSLWPPNRDPRPRPARWREGCAFCDVRGSRQAAPAPARATARRSRRSARRRSRPGSPAPSRPARGRRGRARSGRAAGRARPRSRRPRAGVAAIGLGLARPDRARHSGSRGGAPRRSPARRT